MKNKNIFILKTIDLITLIILYYIVGRKSIFMYVLSLSLYNIFISCFNHITIKDSLNKIDNIESKKKLFKIILLLVSVISLLFLLLSIAVSDAISILLKLNNILLVFIFMGLSIITKPLIKIISEYLENIHGNHKYIKINDIYHIIDNIILLVIALIFFRIFKVEEYVAVSLLYLSKIISATLIIVVVYSISKDNKKQNTITENKINYKKEINYILTKNNYKSTINIVKNSYYYISIIILYLVLSTRYEYATEEIQRNITFIYFYSLGIINYLIFIARELNKELPKESTISNRIYNNFKVMLSIAIVFGIISPLTCKVIFNAPSKSLYLMMTNFMAIFILLYDITFEQNNNRKITYISLISGLIIKLVLTIPLIDSFYRMGYNLVYGDILSTCIGMLLSVIINYIYLVNKNKVKEKYFERILKTLYENILLCIILIILEFIVPIDTFNYFKSLGLIIIYLAISIIFIVLKNKKRG